MPGPTRSRARWARWLLPPVVSIVSASMIVAVLWLRSPGSFPYDDGLNEFLPYLREIGRLLQGGELPILTSRSFSGGNLLIDFERAPFHPVTLLTAIVDVSFGSVPLTAATFAALATAVSLLGGWMVGRAIGLRPPASALVGLVVGASPVFLFLYATNWWNGALGTAGLAWAVAALVWAARRATPWRLVALGCATAVLFISGWPHGMVAFLLTAVVTVLIGVARAYPEGMGWRRLRRSAPVPAAVLLGTLVALPQLSEYLVSIGYLARDSGLGNAGNYGIPTLAQVLGAAIPVGGDWWVGIGGYDHWRVPIGFVSLLVLVAVFFVRWPRALLDDRRLRWALVLAVLFALLTQLPARFGPLHFQFRFLPIAGMFLAIALAIVLERGRPVWSARRFVAAGVSFAAGSALFLMRTPSPVADRAVVLVSLIFVALVIGLLWLVSIPRLRASALAALAAAGSLFVLATAETPGERQVGWPPPPAIRDDLPAAASGFVLSVGDEHRADQYWTGYLSARYLLAGAAVTSGYDPVGQRAFRAIDPEGTVHGLQSVHMLDYLVQPGSAGVGCRLHDWRVTAVVTDADPAAGRHTELIGCDFARTGEAGDAVLFQVDLPAQSGTVSTASPWIEIENSAGTDLVDTVRVSNRAAAPGVVNFARMWWPGYSATLDGAPVAVGTPDGISVQVEVPPGAHGVLELRYWPSSWHWVLPVSLAAMLGLVGLASALGLWERRARRPSP